MRSKDEIKKLKAGTLVKRRFSGYFETIINEGHTVQTSEIWLILETNQCFVLKFLSQKGEIIYPKGYEKEWVFSNWDIL